MLSQKNKMEHVEKVCRLLSDAGFDDKVVDIFHKNKVDQQVLISLDKEDMLELGVVALGDHKRLQQLVCKIHDEEKENVCPSESDDVSLNNKRKGITPMLPINVTRCSPSCGELSVSSYKVPDNQSDFGNVS